MDLAELHLESHLHFAPRSAGGGMRGQAARVRPVNARARCGTPLSAFAARGSWVQTLRFVRALELL